MASGIVVPPAILFGLICLVVMLIIILLLLLLSGKQVPSIQNIKTAFRKKVPIVKFDFPEGTTRILIPGIEHKAANFFKVEGLLKFWDSSGQNSQRLDGYVPMFNVLMNCPESVAPKYAALMFALEDELRKLGHPLDGIQDLFFYVLNEIDRSNKDRETALQNVLRIIGVTDAGTVNRLRAVVNFVWENENLINARISRPIQYDYTTIIRGWDSMQGMTSRNTEQIMVCAEEIANLDHEKKDTSILMYALGFVMVVGVLFFVLKAGNFI